MERLPKFPAEYALAESLKSPAAVLNYEKFSLGIQIKKFRQKAKMKQLELAKKIKTTQSAVARMESGKQNLTLEMLLRIGFALGKKLNARFQ